MAEFGVDYVCCSHGMGLYCGVNNKVVEKTIISLTTTPLPFGPNLAIAGGSAGWIYSSFPQLKELNFLL